MEKYTKMKRNWWEKVRALMIYHGKCAKIIIITHKIYMGSVALIICNLLVASFLLQVSALYPNSDSRIGSTITCN